LDIWAGHRLSTPVYTGRRIVHLVNGQTIALNDGAAHEPCGCNPEANDMTKKTIAIVGAGPGLGLGIARRFGRDGFNVALVGRNAERGRQFVQALEKENVAAAFFPGDVKDEGSIVQAFRSIDKRFGPVEVLEYSPVNIPTDPAVFASLDVKVMTTSAVQDAFAVMALGAVTSVNQVLPGMLERKSGTILITTGISAKACLPMVGAWGMAGSAARNYAFALHEALRDKGIFVGTVCIGVGIKPGDALGDPDKLAENHYTLYRDRKPVEIFIAPKG
jgi:NAD(P)-dependent dehydrogenase (short-subunit alcohol dehydrogenase family)